MLRERDKLEKLRIRETENKMAVALASHRGDEGIPVMADETLCDSKMSAEDVESDASLSGASGSSSSTSRPPWSDELGNIEIEKMDGTDDRPLRIYIDGVFDVTHFGHFRLFQQVKLKFPNSTIIAGVSGDEETLRLKGMTVMNQEERSESIRHCRWVDEVICPCIWIVNEEYMREHRIDYIAHDAVPYGSAGADDIYAFAKRQGRFIATQRTEGISTTGLINRIVKRYNEYVIRNLKRGVDRRELNVSWTREQRILMAEAMKSGAQTLDESVHAWMEDPQRLVDDFVAIFGPRGRIVESVKSSVEQMKTDFIEYAQYAPM